jgi:ribonuclease HI
VDIVEELFRLELALARRDEAALPGGYDGVLDEDFEEIGQSGRAWSRAEMLLALTSAELDSAIDLSLFRAVELAPTVWLARYDTVAVGGRTHRSSIWLLNGDRPRIRFHQGTPAR